MRGAVEKLWRMSNAKIFHTFFLVFGRAEMKLSLTLSLSLILPMSLKIYLNGVKLSKLMREN